MSARICSREMRRVRGSQIALVLQSASSALNPSLTLESHFREAWQAHAKTPWRDKAPEVLETLAALSLPGEPEFLRRYPSQISVGQAQRVLIALALLHQPRLVTLRRQQERGCQQDDEQQDEARLHG